MSTLVVALMIVLTIALLLFLLVFQQDRLSRKEEKEMLQQFIE